MPGEILHEYVNVNKTRVFHRANKSLGGTGNLIMLHGWSFTSKNWEDVGAFQKLVPLGFNVFCPDYPGFGNSQHSERYGIKRGDIRNGPTFVSDYINALGLKSAVILGASMGGGMAVKTALEHENLVDALVAVAPAWIESEKQRLPAIKKPVLFIWGSNDTVVPPLLGPEYSSLVRGSKLKIIEGASHPAYIDRPDEFFRILGDFLKSL